MNLVIDVLRLLIWREHCGNLVALLYDFGQWVCHSPPSSFCYCRVTCYSPPQAIKFILIESEHLLRVLFSSFKWLRSGVCSGDFQSRLSKHRHDRDATLNYVTLTLSLDIMVKAFDDFFCYHVGVWRLGCQTYLLQEWTTPCLTLLLDIHHHNHIQMDMVSLLVCSRGLCGWEYGMICRRQCIQLLLWLPPWTCFLGTDEERLGFGAAGISPAVWALLHNLVLVRFG